MDLEAVEMAIRGSMHSAGAAALSRLLAMPETRQPEVACGCGHLASYHERRPKQLLTVLGRVDIQRAYYICPHCHQGQSSPR